MNQAQHTRCSTPDEWAGRLSGPADLSSDKSGWTTALLRHWTGTSPEMDQPPLDHHYIVQHLGGPKKVERRLDGAPVSTIVECGALTIVPVGTQFKWHTQGPIEFAHLYISPLLMSRMALRLERAGELSLVDRVGCRDPLLEAVYGAMLAEIRRPLQAEVLYLDSLLDTFLMRLLTSYCTARVRHPRKRESLAGFQRKRVTDYIEAHLARPLTLTDLAQAAGGSLFHFSRAFKNTTGDSPYNYVLRRRAERGKTMLNESTASIEAVAQACGFSSAASFSKTFVRFVGTTPKRYRRARC